jgi:hypothetical protein
MPKPARAASHDDSTFIRVERTHYCDMTLLVALPQMLEIWDRREGRCQVVGPVT